MDEMTEGYAAYVAKFGDEFEELRGVPWQVQPSYGAWWPLSLYEDNVLGRLLGRCASEGRRATAKEAVDAYFLKDGRYSGDVGGRLLEADTYDEFLKKASEVNNFDV